MTTQRPSFIASVWEFFCSLKLTMFLLISLAIVSIIGTIIPQGAVPPEYAEQISPTKLKLYQSLGFFDMYHSWWFILFLSFLTLNLICCSIKRLPYIWKIITVPETIFSSRLEQSLSAVVSIPSTLETDHLKEKVAGFLSSQFAAPVVTEAEGGWHFFSQKNSWCRLSVYFVHLSVIVIFIGAIIGSLFGYKAGVTIFEGDTVSSVMSRDGKEIPLDFSLRCEKFSVAYYKTGAPREFKSILTVLEQGKPVPGYTNVPVIVNDPLSYKGITFYQSSYGNDGNFFFTISTLDGTKSMPISVGATSSTTLPDGSSMHVIEATDDISAYAPSLSGPAAQVEIHSPQGQTKKFIVYANHPELNIKHAKEQSDGVVLQYQGAKKKMYTGLQVAKDPGVWIVWLGCLLMVVGIYAAFFLSHRRIWVRISNGVVTMGGNSSKNPGAFRNDFDGLTTQLKTQLSPEEQQ